MNPQESKNTGTQIEIWTKTTTKRSAQISMHVVLFPYVLLNIYKPG